MKALLFIAALALLIAPVGANAYLILNPVFESTTSYRPLFNISLPDEVDQKTLWLSAASFSRHHFAFDTEGETRSNTGWTAETTAMLFSRLSDTSPGPITDNYVQAQKKADQISTSIILFAPGLAGILARRHWPQKSSWRTLKRRFFELIHVSPRISIHGDLQRRILLTTGFLAYFQFIHFKLRTIQMNQ